MVFSFACVRAVVELSSVRVGPRDASVSACEVSAAVVDLGFRKEHRLCKTDEYSSVFAFRKANRGQFFELLQRPSSSDTARIGMVIAKKFIRSAVNRNLIRRIVRESFRQFRNELPQRDIVVRIIVRIDTPDRHALRRDIDGLFAHLAQ